MASANRELRIALVLNGGVSLAVWIGGVVHEIDRLRRALAPDADDVGPYRTALMAGGYGSVRVDVIAGASAGGINGALLAAAIQGGTADGGVKPLRKSAAGEPLRDVWVELGDLAAITRGPGAPGDRSLPSVLTGDRMVETLEEILSYLLVDDAASILRAADGPPASLTLYLTTTDLRGRAHARFATSDEVIEELDHRIVLRFAANAEDEADVPPPGTAGLAERLVLERDNARRLALAARASSSFPVAFSPLEAELMRGDGKVAHTYMVDGGILDNQPFNPVLDRITQLPVEGPWRRVICYVVPYVSEGAPTGVPTLIDVATSGGLARDLPKLESLQRIESDRQRASAAHYAFLQLGSDFDGLIEAADSLLPLYRRVQAAELVQTALAWQRGPSESGGGPSGEPDTVSQEQIAAPVLPPDVGRLAVGLDPLLPAKDFATAASGWEADDGSWTWGLSKAERFARTALAWVGWVEEMSSRPPEQTLVHVRRRASDVSAATRTAIRARRSRFKEIIPGAGDDPQVEAFVASYRRVRDETGRVADAVAELCAALAVMFEAVGDPISAREAFARLAAVEVVRHAAGTRRIDPPGFDFYRFSARTPPPFSGGQEPLSPKDKLAGMGLMHFAAFLKRSWRANDWMQGRLDGAYWISRMLAEGGASGVPAGLRVGILREELPALAAAARADRRAGFSASSDVMRWCEAHAEILGELERDPTAGKDAAVIAAFSAWKLEPGGFAAEMASAAGTRTFRGLGDAALGAVADGASGLPRRVRRFAGIARRLGGGRFATWLAKLRSS